MRVAVASDIHVDGYEFWGTYAELLSEEIYDHGAELFVLCGDVTNDIVLFKHFMSYFCMLLEKQGIELLFVPGNHDVWVTNSKFPLPSSKEKYYQVLPNIFNKINNAHYLPTKPYVIDDYAFVGNMGWYDYSYSSDNYSRAVLLCKKYLQYTWLDYKYVHWDGKKDEEILEELMLIFDEQLESVKDKNVIACTHMVPLKKFCKSKMGEGFDFFTAYMGSEKIFDVIKKYPNIKRALYGHTHYVGNEAHENIQFINASIGHRFQNKGSTTKAFIRKRLQCFSI